MRNTNSNLKNYSNQYDFIGVETINAKGLIRKNAYLKVLLMLLGVKVLSMLTYKAEKIGKALMQIDKFFPSSQICSTCGDSTSGVKIWLHT